ncbi:hypothetical protein FVE85_0401 [Porphyridium purpureum]|uniref:Uncharacterized protein n=1 Tax=Porphyridium purpureum TaxID=35688 RepID=A0A5J4Z0N1_PORPP|nr:hypothetical protein FVE85_0401 [Porphyridium purpureum]|eukprot:POR4430..scf208_2
MATSVTRSANAGNVKAHDRQTCKADSARLHAQLAAEKSIWPMFQMEDLELDYVTELNTSRNRDKSHEREQIVRISDSIFTDGDADRKIAAVLDSLAAHEIDDLPFWLCTGEWYEPTRKQGQIHNISFAQPSPRII